MGRRLFQDASLSADGRTSCASCHAPDALFADGRPVSIGAHGRRGTRNAPSLLDAGSLPALFWDGRENELERAALQPFTNPVEMGLSGRGQLLAKAQAGNAYPLPSRARGGADAVDDERWIAAALAAYLRTLRSPPSRLQLHLRPTDPVPLSADAAQGMALFRGKAECAACHLLDGTSPSLTDQRYHHTGVGFGQISGNVAQIAAELAALPQARLAARILGEREVAELGRFAASRRPQDLGAFRTPSLYNVADTAPYMHDGSVATLEDAVEREIYYRSLARGRPISLTVEEQRQLVAFLRALSPPSPAR